MIHVLTAFSRRHLLPVLIEDLQKQDVLWHPILAEDFAEDFPVEHLSWIQPAYSKGFTEKTSYDICYAKLNWFLDNVDLIPQDYYVVMNDDDRLCSGFTTRIRLDSEVVFYSMHNRPGCWLKAVHGKLGVCSCGFQYAVRGDVLLRSRKTAGMFRVGEHAADGVMACHLQTAFRCVYQPEIYITHNRYCPGWWPENYEERCRENSF